LFSVTLTDSSLTARVKPNWRERESLKLRQVVVDRLVQKEKMMNVRGSPDEALASTAVTAGALTAFAFADAVKA
jgi:hypothetical protein